MKTSSYLSNIIHICNMSVIIIILYGVKYFLRSVSEYQLDRGMKSKLEQGYIQKGPSKILVIKSTWPTFQWCQLLFIFFFHRIVGNTLSTGTMEMRKCGSWVRGDWWNYLLIYFFFLFCPAPDDIEELHLHLSMYDESSRVKSIKTLHKNICWSIPCSLFRCI